MEPVTEIVRHFFEQNITLFLFVYGQVFFVLGLAIALQSRRHSRLELARSLSWLAAFGIVHGLHEWGAVFIPLQATYVHPVFLALLQILHVILLALSFGFLFQFGVELLRDRWPRLLALPLILTVLWSFWFILPGLGLNTDFARWHDQASIWGRYLLGFPAGLLAAYGLRYQAEQQIKPLGLNRIYQTLRVAGLALAAYGIAGGLIVPPGNFFPANWLNEANLVNWLGVPALVFRSLTGLVMTVAIIRALEVFDLEVDRLIEQMQREQSLAAERERIGRELHDGAIQQVYTAGLIVEAARNKIVEEPAQASRRLERAITVLNGAIASLRAYMSELRAGSAASSLIEGLRQQAADPGLATLMDINLELNLPEENAFTPVQINHILAIVAEALSNAARHAQARRVWLRAAQSNGHLDLSIRDDGLGFPISAGNDGYGLRNMQDRARLLGGRLTVVSQPGGGTEIQLVAPVENR
jgi:signal transduction histidine kinase